jgi:hypothetical protein
LKTFCEKLIKMYILLSHVRLKKLIIFTREKTAFQKNQAKKIGS